MPYQGVAFFFMLGVGIATAALMYLLREEERLEQPYGNGDCGGGNGANSAGEDLRATSPRYNEHPPRRRQTRVDGSVQICAICQDDLDSGLPFRRLHCDHQFHKRCIDQWARTRRDCPNCRRSF